MMLFQRLATTSFRRSCGNRGLGVVRSPELGDEGRALSWGRLTLVLINTGLVSLVALAWIVCGSISSGLGYLRGDRLVPDAYSRSFGTVEEGSTILVTFTLRNFTRRAVKILGGRCSCTCVRPVGLPVVIPPSQRVPFYIEVLAGGKRGTVSETVRLYTDAPQSCDIELTVSGAVDASRSR